MSFLNKINKQLEKDGIDLGTSVPRYWHSAGNYALNRIISGSFYHGIPQGRVTGLMGPSGSGKSFLSANLLREAQQDDTLAIVIDSEHSFDEKFAKAIGVDTSDEIYSYMEVETISECKKAASTVINGYLKEFGTIKDAPKVMILIDSLDMLMTDSEETNFEKGISKGDQGQRNKQLKAMLREFVQAIKKLNISMVITGQVYPNQDLRNGEGLWIVSQAVRYALSQIILLTKIKLREGTEAIGINMRCEGYKTRFTKPFQKIEIEVPYDTGMNPYSGLIDAAMALGVVQRKGSYYVIDGEEDKWYAKHIDKHIDKLLPKCEELSKSFLVVDNQKEIEIPDTSITDQRMENYQNKRGRKKKDD